MNNHYTTALLTLEAKKKEINLKQSYQIYYAYFDSPQILNKNPFDTASEMQNAFIEKGHIIIKP